MGALEEVWQRFGPGLAGAVFGMGWWFWVDAVVCSKVTVPFVHYLPGIFASLAALMFNLVRREDLRDYSSLDDGAGCSPSTWPGTAGVLQSACVLASGIMYWLSRSGGDSSFL
eukprot:jgi/Mesen1/3868/ME000207S02885